MEKYIDLKSSLTRRLQIQLKIEYADMNVLNDEVVSAGCIDELESRMRNKCRLQLRDTISLLKSSLISSEPA